MVFKNKCWKIGSLMIDLEIQVNCVKMSERVIMSLIVGKSKDEKYLAEKRLAQVIVEQGLSTEL